MAQSYAARLKKGISYGSCGLPENFDTERVLKDKIRKVAEMIKESKYVVVHTGAGKINCNVNQEGVSTSTGIPDFRGPNGVWTKEQKGILDPHDPHDFRFEDARPSLTHMALLGLLQAGRLKFICSQNVDGLHLRSGIPRSQISELHGNVFVGKFFRYCSYDLEECEKCDRQYFRSFDVQGIGFEYTGRLCDCGGKLRDTLLDWDDALPGSLSSILMADEDYELAQKHSRKADMILCLGTSLRVEPANKIPLLTKRNNGKLVICNLQKTPIDPKCTLKVHARCDILMREVMQILKIPIPVYKHREIFISSLSYEDSQWIFRLQVESKAKRDFIDNVTLSVGNDSVELKDFPVEHSWKTKDLDGKKLNVSVSLRNGCEPETFKMELTFRHGDQQQLSVVTETLDYNQSKQISVKEELISEKAEEHDRRKRQKKVK